MAFGGEPAFEMSDEVFDFICTGCAGDNKTEEAVKYCVDCRGYCCQSCTDVHTFPALRSHTLLDVSQGKQYRGQQPNLPEFPTERCSLHRGQVVDMYCDIHDDVGCSTCFFKYHKSCPDKHIMSIPESIDSIFKFAECEQTRALLKELTVSMETLIQSRDAELESFNKTKEETIETILAFQEELVAMIARITEQSIHEIEAAYDRLEREILQAKQRAEDMFKYLQAAEDKIDKSEGNRAERFVWTKKIQKKISEANEENFRQEKRLTTDIEITFVPDESLKEYIHALQYIGRVYIEKHELYQIKSCRDIAINLSDDFKICSARGSCLIPDNKLIITDSGNKKLKRIDTQKLTVIDDCVLDSTPNGVCFINNHDVAVACNDAHKVQFVTIRKSMTPSNQFSTSHKCYGIAYKNDTLYLTDGNKTFYIYDLRGNMLRKMSHDDVGNRLFNASRHIAFNSSADKLFVGDWGNGVVCFDDQGKYLTTITANELSNVEDACVDRRGNLLAIGWNSRNVVQFGENGKKHGVIVKEMDGIERPRSLCFLQELNRLFVTMWNSDAMRVYDLDLETESGINETLTSEYIV